MRSWIDYWDSDHAIYVNARHKAAHAAGIAADFRRHIAAAGPAKPVVLDHGCGEALYAEAIAPSCDTLLLCEAAPTIRKNLVERLAGLTNVRVVNPDKVKPGAIPPVDLVVANSLLQYLGRPELEALLDAWRQVLAPGGRVLLADVIPPGVSPATDAAALLRFGWRGGFMVPAVIGLARTALSDYGKIRKSLGFSMYSEADMLALMAAHGYQVRRIHPNFGHNQARMTFEGTLN
ncbi:MAG: class I SAM-dependent methyltransferase [Hyphomicrobiaceae bacterium]